MNNNDLYSEDIDRKYVETSSLNEDINNIAESKSSSFKRITDIIFKGDKIIWLVFLILCVISLVEIFSATSTLVYKGGNHWTPIFRHAMFLVGGFFLILIMHNIPYKYYSSLIFVLIVSILLLLFLLVFGQKTNDSARWIHLFGFTFQPSEFAKISLMATMAFLLSRHKRENESLYFKWMVGLMVVVSGIIALENLSTALLLFSVCFLMMFVGGVKISRLLKLAGVSILLAVSAFLLLKNIPQDNIISKNVSRISTWQSRIEKFGSHNDDESKDAFSVDDNYQVAFSKIAIANGRVFGKFPGNSKARDFLPQAYSDFIYAIIIEEMGLIGGAFVLLLYIVILIRSGIIASRVDNLFPKYLVIGSALMLSFQALINMAVAVNLIPVTGQPLPLISRGGTSTLVTCAYFGLILSADRFSRNKKKNKEHIDDQSDIIDVDNVMTDIDKIDEKKESKLIQI